MKNLIARGVDCYSLSHYLDDSEYALLEKNIWEDKHISEIDQQHRIFVPFGENKGKFIDGGITESDYLIDDYTPNLIDWEARGGTGIKILNGINHTKGTWKGLFIHHENSNIANIIINEFIREDYIQSNQDVVSNDYNRAYLYLKNELREQQRELLAILKNSNLAKEESYIYSKQLELDTTMFRMRKEMNKHQLEIINSNYNASINKVIVNYRLLETNESNKQWNSYVAVDCDNLDTSVLSIDSVERAVWNNNKVLIDLMDLSPLCKKIILQMEKINFNNSITFNLDMLAKLHDTYEIPESEIKQLINEIHINNLDCIINYVDGKLDGIKVNNSIFTQINFDHEEESGLVIDSITSLKKQRDLTEIIWSNGKKYIGEMQLDNKKYKTFHITYTCSKHERNSNNDYFIVLGKYLNEKENQYQITDVLDFRDSPFAQKCTSNVDMNNQNRIYDLEDLQK